MPGQYKKAPLVYVTARIRTTPIPNLSPDQVTLIQQVMVKNGLVIPVTSQGKSVNINPLATMNPADLGTTPAINFQNITRYGFLAFDRTQCLVIDADGIEWRASQYTKYENFVQSFTKILDALIETVDVFGFIHTQELVLSYADLITPMMGRSLGDYFKNADAILPLSFLKDKKQDVRQMGQIQVVRIIKPTQKITISLEQLPVLDKKVHKYLPAEMIEPDNALSMPILLREESKYIEATSYGLLMTQAGLLENFPLKTFNIDNEFKALHKLTSDTFKSLLNEEICNQDWEYTDNIGAH